MIGRCRVAACVLGALILAAPDAQAQLRTPDDSLNAADQALFELEYMTARSMLTSLLRRAQGLSMEDEARAQVLLGFAYFDDPDDPDPVEADRHIESAILADMHVDPGEFRALTEEYRDHFTRQRDAIIARMPSTLTVTSIPWATVRMGPSALGSTPLIGHSLTADTYVLRLDRPGYVGYAQSITVQPGRSMLLGPYPLQRVANEPPDQPFRDRIAARGSWLAETLARLDSADIAGAVQLVEIGRGIVTDQDRASRSVLHGVISLIRGQNDAAREHFGVALEADGTVQIGADDFDETAHDLFRRAALASLPTADFVDMTDQFMVGRDSAHLRIRVNRGGSVTASIRDPRGERIIWERQSQAAPMVDLAWSGLGDEAGPGQVLSNGEYELTVQPYTGDGRPGQGFTARLTVRSQRPDTAAHVGPVPDSLLVRETRGGGARAASVVRGVLFGAAAVGLAVAASSGWDGPQGADYVGSAGVGAGIALVGIIGGIATSSNALVPERVEQNRRVVAEWTQRQQDIVRANAELLARPYRMTITTTVRP